MSDCKNILALFIVGNFKDEDKSNLQDFIVDKYYSVYLDDNKEYNISKNEIDFKNEREINNELFILFKNKILDNKQKLGLMRKMNENQSSFTMIIKKDGSKIRGIYRDDGEGQYNYFFHNLNNKNKNDIIEIIEKCFEQKDVMKKEEKTDENEEKSDENDIYKALSKIARDNEFDEKYSIETDIDKLKEEYQSEKEVINYFLDNISLKGIEKKINSEYQMTIRKFGNSDTRSENILDFLENPARQTIIIKKIRNNKYSIKLEYIRNGEIFDYNNKITNKEENIKKKYKEDLREEIINYIIAKKNKLKDIEFIYEALVEGLRKFLIERMNKEYKNINNPKIAKHFLLKWFGGKKLTKKKRSKKNKTRRT